ncbi:MAG: SDR family oxidoreductase, partial [Candidatus Omnitrophica bacterium]|nr:SDR family oxidoreductase [Candidatus Omnitrophota bacterium]
MNKRVLITGGFGYLGGRIAIDVARRTSWQICLASRRNLEVPPWLPEAQTVTFDLSKPEGFEAVLKGVQAVVHLAAINEGESRRFPEKAVETNTIGTLRLLDAAVGMGVERFIYFSTVHIYGSPLAGCITERSLPRPMDPYAITHHAAEEFVLSARDKGCIQ